MVEAVNAWFTDFEARILHEVGQNALTEDTLESVDWTQLTAWHLALIRQVSDLHAKEESVDVQRIMERNLSTQAVMEAQLNGIRGHRIYLLKNPPEMLCDVVGDLHSDPFSFMQLLRQTGFIASCLQNKPHRLVFMGDYVDRGKAHLDLLGRLLLLKSIFPDRVFLLRGNHDGGTLEGPNQVKLPYRKPEDEPDEDYFPTYLLKLKAHRPVTEALLEAYLDFFNNLGQMALIQTGSKITLAVHGGLPRPVLTEDRYFAHLNCLADLSDVNLIDAHGRTMVQNVMWSDPYRGSGDLREGMGRFFYTEAHFDDFAKTTGIHQMLRGHEAFDAGYAIHFGRKVHTIFSSGQWPSQTENPMTAYPNVTAKWARVTSVGKIEIHPKKSDICY